MSGCRASGDRVLFLYALIHLIAISEILNIGVDGIDLALVAPLLGIRFRERVSGIDLMGNILAERAEKDFHPSFCREPETSLRLQPVLHSVRFTGLKSSGPTTVTSVTKKYLVYGSPSKRAARTAFSRACQRAERSSFLQRVAKARLLDLDFSRQETRRTDARFLSLIVRLAPGACKGVTRDGESAGAAHKNMEVPGLENRCDRLALTGLTGTWGGKA